MNFEIFLLIGICIICLIFIIGIIFRILNKKMKKTKKQIKMKHTHFTQLRGQIITGTYNNLALTIRESGLLGSRILKLEYL